MPKLRAEISDANKKNNHVSCSVTSANKLQEIALLKMLECAMEEMVRFELQDEDIKTYDFKEYINDYMML